MARRSARRLAEAGRGPAEAELEPAKPAAGAEPADKPQRRDLAAAARLRGRGWLITLVAVALAACGLGLLAGHFIISPRQLAAESQPPPPTVITAAVVEQRIERTIVTRGIISAVDTVQVGQGFLVPPDDNGGGTDQGVLTGVFAAVGDEIAAGRAVVEISGRPLVVLPGAKAGWRDMKPGMSGDDVRQLQAALRDLGFFSGSVSGTFDSATKRAVEKFYAHLGYTAPTTDGGDGSDAQTLQQAQDAVTDAERAWQNLKDEQAQAEQAFTAARAAWEQSQRSTASPAPSPAPSPAYQGPTAAQLSQAELTLQRAKQSLERERTRRGPIVPRQEMVFVPRLPATVTQIGQGLGYAPSRVLFTLTTAALELTSDVATSQAGLLHLQGSVEIQLPTGPRAGVIAALTPNPDNPSSTQVAIDPASPLELAWAGLDVRVTFVAAATAGQVLAVPQGALASNASGQLSVIVQRGEQTFVRVPVAAGVSGDSLVEVTPLEPGALRAGDQVVIGG
jgi:peptidoglycan hydrolase-like protein with peptidoglycan-binding domain